MNGPTDALARLPKVELAVVDERRVGDGGFLAVRRLELTARRDHSVSRPFGYDLLDRRALDASVMVAHHAHDGRVHVWLRSSVRPPLALRPPAARSSSGDLPATIASGVLWEVPAGLVEPGESPRDAAARELHEELGFAVDPADLVPLGPPAAPAPGFVGEVHFYFHIRVDPVRRAPPGGDGSPLEDDAVIVSVPLDDALDACRAGLVPDAKTELALRRLADVFAMKHSPRSAR